MVPWGGFKLLAKPRSQMRDPAAHERRHELTDVSQPAAKIKRWEARRAKPSIERAKQRPHRSPIFKGAERVASGADDVIVAGGAQSGEAWGRSGHEQTHA